MIRKRVQAPVVLLILIIGAAMVTYYFLKARGQDADSKQTIDPQAIIDNKENLGVFLAQNGPKKTIQTLFALSTQNSFDCHQKAHEAGRLAYKIFGAEKAFREGSGECHSGYYHGTIERYFADNGTANLSLNLAKLCSSDLNPFFRHQCYHGVGHGLMGWASYEINDALKSCELLENGTDQSSCTTGVFMENYTGAFQEQSQNASHSSKFLSDDPHYPCNIIEDKHKSNCYFLQTSRMLQIFGPDFKKVAEECSRAPQAYQYLCFASLGRDVGGATRGKPDESIAKCRLAPEGEAQNQCLMGAVQDYFWDPAGTEAAINFCEVLTDAQEKDSCYGTIIGRAADVLTDANAKNNFCNQAESNYKEQCTKTLL